MNFASDNAEGWAPEILDALQQVNNGPASPYGDDECTAQVTAALSKIFERDVAVFLVPTGTAANGLALATLCPRYGSVFVHEASHVQLDECGAPEFFTGGAKLIPLPGDNGKIAPETLEAALATVPPKSVHHVPARVLSLTQATECGTAYTPAEVSALSQVAKARKMAIHMDGARFANALVHLGCTPAEATWKAGVDVLSFGATKNGCIAAEALIFFDPDMAADVAYLRKRSGHLFSKHRFLSSQMQAYLKDDLWLKLARHANQCASDLGAELAQCPGSKVWYPVEGNEVFVSLEAAALKRLRGAGAVFHPWVMPGDPAGGQMVRLVTSFRTDKKDVARFIDVAKGA